MTLFLAMLVSRRHSDGSDVPGLDREREAGSSHVIERRFTRNSDRSLARFLGP